MDRELPAASPPSPVEHARLGAERPVGAKPVGMGEAAGPGHHGDHESDK
ncbi:MAG: hypothetical protein Q8Q59_00735 [Luteolibacter sp.]|nr:hypothetical protein [Luteolibacter sp.]